LFAQWRAESFVFRLKDCVCSGANVSATQSAFKIVEMFFPELRTDVMIFKIFSPKKIGVFFLLDLVLPSSLQKLDHKIGL
jgi:hypothetical protein